MAARLRAGAGGGADFRVAGGGLRVEQAVALPGGVRAAARVLTGGAPDGGAKESSGQLRDLLTLRSAGVRAVVEPFRGVSLELTAERAAPGEGPPRPAPPGSPGGAIGGAAGGASPARFSFLGNRRAGPGGGEAAPSAAAPLALRTWGPFAAPASLEDRLRARLRWKQESPRTEVSLLTETDFRLGDPRTVLRLEQALEDANMLYGKASLEVDAQSRLLTAAGETYLFSENPREFVTVGGSLSRERARGYLEYEGLVLPLPLRKLGLYGFRGRVGAEQDLASPEKPLEKSYEVTYGLKASRGALPGLQLKLSGTTAGGGRLDRPGWSVGVLYGDDEPAALRLI